MGVAPFGLNNVLGNVPGNVPDDVPGNVSSNVPIELLNSEFTGWYVRYFLGSYLF